MIYRLISAIVVFVGAVCISYATSIHIAAITSGNVVFRTFLCICTFLTVLSIIIHLAFFLGKDRY